jgi:DNA mismatch repair ATPase MutS
MIDLGQVSQALRGVTARSLLLLDEFGKGMREGLRVGVAAACLR